MLSILQTFQVFFYLILFLLTICYCNWRMHESEVESLTESLLNNGLGDIELEEVVGHQPEGENFSTDDTCSI